MKRVLITPLDWGLGHASRCIPIIRQLILRGCVVSVAGSGASLKLLNKEFPRLTFFELQGYDPKYPRSKGAMVWKMASQLPKFFSAIKAEHLQIEKLIADHRFDLLISDNRYGCWSSNIPCVFITHQSNILMPKRFGWLGPLVKFFNERWMSRFDQCWIPDFSNGNSLTGQLNDIRKMDKTRFKFIGPLSRFISSGKKRVQLYNVTVILSGPEPQRSMLEKIIRLQLEATDIKYAMVRGVFDPPTRSIAPNIFDYLTSNKLQELIETSEVIVARSGYSTVMDMAALRKKVIFVPTPGQTEQEYLAKHLFEKGIAFAAEQNQFDLQRALLETKNVKGFKHFEMQPNLLSDAIDSILQIKRLVKIS